MRDVGVGQLVEELEQRGDRLPFEIGAFVALEACEGLLQQSVRIEPDDVRVTLEGAVVVSDSATAAEPDEAARSLVSVLARLLVAAGPGVPPYLLQLVKQSSVDSADRDLKTLHDAIEASLIPVNRGASRRVLARLVRESDRPPAPAAPPVPDIDPQELDAELNELLRDPALRTLEPRRATPPEPPAAPTADDDPVTERIRVPRGVREDFGVDASADAGGAAPATAAVAEPGPLASHPEPVTATIRKWVPEEDDAPQELEELEEVEEPVEPEEPEEQLETARESDVELSAGPAETAPPEVSEPVEAETPTELVFSHGSASTAESIPAPEPVARESRVSAPTRPSVAQPLPQRRGGWGAWLLVAALGVGVYALISTGALQSLVSPAAPAPAPSGVVTLEVAPEGAQVFLYVGRGPSVAAGLEVGRAHEFVVFHEGLRPTRVTVPEGAAWPSVEGRPLYELAVQPQPAGSVSEAADFGTPLTKSGPGADGNEGAVRIVTNPPGAKVYRYLGVGPDVRLSVDSIHEGQEVLVVHPGYETRRAVIGPSDWVTVDGAPHASLRVELPEVPSSVVVPETVED
jgi:hypothetical protein